MIQDFLTLGMLILLQAVLGFDNLLYISLESQKAPVEKRAFVRRWGIIIAMFLRIALLFSLVNLIKYFQEPVFSLDSSVMSGSFNIHSIIVLFGGVFIIYTAMKEIIHMLRIEDHDNEEVKSKSTISVIFWIVIMNVIFSFDSILSAMALTDTLWVMIVAIIISGFLMMWISDRVSKFLQKNRMFEILGLMILFIVGLMLSTEGGELAKMHIFGEPIEAMSTTTFYFVLVIVVVNDVIQSFYEKKLRK